MQKIFYTFSLLLLVLVLTACSNGPVKAVTPISAPTPSGDTNPVVMLMVSIKDFTFSPSSLTIRVGQSVKWINQDPVPHALLSDTFKSGTLQTGDSFTNKFLIPGTFTYSCSIHPSMKGVIIVK